MKCLRPSDDLGAFPRAEVLLPLKRGLRAIVCALTTANSDPTWAAENVVFLRPEAFSVFSL
jgi:hypothetical protein